MTDYKSNLNLTYGGKFAVVETDATSVLLSDKFSLNFSLLPISDA